MSIVTGNVIFVLLILLFVISIFDMWKLRGRKTIITLGAIFVLAAIIIILTSWIHPVKYAVQEEDFSDYSEYILVREVHYTGTGWSMVGDTGGWFPSEEVVDVILEGEKLPEARTPAERYNTFLCIVEYQGKKKHVVFEEELDCYVIRDWYPVYPVVRNERLLPQFCYPRGYMTEKDIKGY